MRGEKLLSVFWLAVLSGSPPLARGKAPGKELLMSCTRITPACAGKRFAKDADTSPEEDHPRLRGEKDSTSVLSVVYRGSPPLARGKESLSVVNNFRNGITPACAGKSGYVDTIIPPHRDHPRLRGEKPPLFRFFILSIGSPPLARGKGRTKYFIRAACGITPACAGKSLKRSLIQATLRSSYFKFHLVSHKHKK